MLKNLRQTARRAAAACGKRLAAESALRLHRRPLAEPADPTVHMLVSSKTWHAGLLAAVSFEHHTGHRWNFVIHDDGTVPKAAAERISKILPDVRFVPRSEANARAQTFLSGHPKCLEHRSRHNLFLKFFDFAAFAPGERFIVLDSDVIFFRCPDEILAWTNEGADTCHYNEDTKEKYCIPRSYIEDALGVPMWPRFNSGLVLLPREAFDLDLAERLLATFETTAHHPQFFEQTLYGLMASAWNKGGALPRSYEISWGYFHHRGAVCRHYVGEFKHDLLYIEGGPALLLRSIAAITLRLFRSIRAIGWLILFVLVLVFVLPAALMVMPEGGGWINHHPFTASAIRSSERPLGSPANRPEIGIRIARCYRLSRRFHHSECGSRRIRFHSA